MPTDDRPLRDVLREVDEILAHKEMNPFDRYLYGRLARELRAVAPMLRECQMYGSKRELRAKAQELADELEAK